MPPSPERRCAPRLALTPRRLLAWLLVLGLLRGLLYVVLLPPWQHYDEPSHFEYVRLIVERGALPRLGDLDLELRRSIAGSMQAHGFWRGPLPPEPDSSSPPRIGETELIHPPLYYALLAVPQLLVHGRPVETQLYLARATSLLLLPVVLLSAYGACAEAFPHRRWLPLACSGFLAFLPPFTDLMSSVSSDAGAAAAGSLFLWASLRLIRRGPTARRVAACLLAALLCLAAKSSAGLVALCVSGMLGLSYLPRTAWRWLPAAAALPLLAAGLWAGTSRRTAAHWYSGSPDSAPSRTLGAAPWGRWVFRLSAQGDSAPRSVSQELPWSKGRSLRGTEVSFGAWFRADEETQGFAVLNLYDGTVHHWHQVPLNADWEFHCFTAAVSPDSAGLLLSAILPDRQGAAREVLVDGLVLSQGSWPASSLEQASGAPQRGAAAPQEPENLLKNGSAEAGWPLLPSWLGERALFRDRLARVFYSAWEVGRTGWAYAREVRVLIRSFWGGFGWNHLQLPAGAFYPLAAWSLLAGAGCAGAVVWRMRRAPSLSAAEWRILLTLGVAFAASWLGAMLRIHPVFVTARVSWPVARYAVASIVPTSILLCAGWAVWLPRRWSRGAACLGLGVLLLIDALAVWGVLLPYYYG